MTRTLTRLMADETGLVLSAELVLILTVCVLGIIVGLASVQTAVVSEFQDLSLALSGMNQSYATPAFFGCRKWGMPISFTVGSGYVDYYDSCACGIVGGAGMEGFGGGSAIGGGGVGGVGGGGGYREIHTPGALNAPATTPVPGAVTEPAVPCQTCPPGTSAPSNGTLTPLPDAAPRLPTAPLPTNVPHSQEL